MKEGEVTGSSFRRGFGTGSCLAFMFLLLVPLFIPASAMAAAPGNDNFAAAQTLTGPPASTTGTNVDATREVGEPDHGSFGGGSSVWYAWTAPSSGPVVVDLSGSDYDTYLAVYSGSTLDSLSLVAEDDDGGDGLTSKLIFSAALNETYRIAVDGYAGEAGSIALSLYSPGSISGNVTGVSASLPGLDPLEDICVTVYDPGGKVAGSALSDSDGNYTIGGLKEGDHRVRFSDCGFNNVVSEYFNDKPDLASADPVAVTAGSETSGINAVLAEGGSISGTVTNSSAVLLENICVDVFDSAGDPSSSDSTDSNGNFNVDDLPTGNFRVRFQDCGSNNVLGEYFNNKPDLASADPVAVTAGSETSGINAVLADGGSISGTVTDLSAVLLANICVDVFDSAGDPSGSGYTGPDGKYKIGALNTGSYRVRFSDCGSGTFSEEYYDNQPDLASANPVAVTAGSGTANINAQMTSLGPVQRTLTAAVTGAGSGLVTSSPPGIDCGETCSHVYDDGTVVTLTAAPDPGSTFAGWSGAGCSGTGTCQVTLTSDQIATATFEVIPASKASINRVKVNGPARIKRGKRATYRVQISNSGNAEATGVRLKVSGRGVRFNASVGSITAATTRTVKVRLKPKRPGRLRATFRVNSGNAGGRTVRKTITIRR